MLQAIFGWQTLRQAELYTRMANRTRLAAPTLKSLMCKVMVPRDGLLQVNWIKHLAAGATGQKSHIVS